IVPKHTTNTFWVIVASILTVAATMPQDREPSQPPMSSQRFRKHLRSGGLLLAAAAVVWLTVPYAVSDDDDSNTYLFICAGDQARTSPDFLAVINFDQESRDYGKVIATVPFAAPDATGNEPHHSGLSSDGKVVACGGLLSALKGQKEIFFFNVSNPRAPKFTSAADPPLSAITDEFHALPEGGYLVTMMGGAQGHAPGRVAAFDKNLQLLKEYPENPPSDGFNPHGISVRPELNLMVTSDFACPSTTLDVVPGGLDLRGSIRVWDLRNRTILRTVQIPGAGGTIDVRLIPGDPQARGYTARI